MLRPSRQAARAAGWMGCVFALWSVFAAGASIEVNPVRLTLSAAQPVAALTVRNAGTQPAGLHLQVMAWTQSDAADQYVATRELLATPPIFTLAPGAVQTVRVGLRRAADPKRELAYRLYLQEIPSAAAVDGAGVRITLRIGVPVFVPPGAPAAPHLRWQAQRDGNAVVLHAQNTGSTHARILELTFLSGSRTLAKTTAAYVLAGQSWRWRFAASPMPAAGAPLRVRAKTTTGEMDADVVLE